MKAGDQIIGVNGTNTFFLQDFQNAMKDKREESVNFTVLRNERDTLKIAATVNDKGRLGIQNVLLDGFAPEQKQKYSFGEAIPKGVDISYNFLTGQLKAFKQMFAGKIKATDSLGSVFSIAKMFDSDWNWEQFWKITAMLSILLGFFNLLPIPALDGGYVMFLIWEVVTGRKPNDKFMEYATMVGFFILIGLMIFALGLDVSKWFK